jgi:hypothetical protein
LVGVIPHDLAYSAGYTITTNDDITVLVGPIVEIYPYSVL